MAEKCAACNKKEFGVKSMSKKQNWLNCDGCKKWYHAEFVLVKTDVEFEHLQSKPKWFCPRCIADSNISRVVAGLVQSKEAADKKDDGAAGGSIENIDVWVAEQLKAMWPRLTSYCDNAVAEVKAEMASVTSKLNDRIVFLERQFELYKRRDDMDNQKVLMLYGIPDAVSIYDHSFMPSIAEEVDVQSFKTDDVKDVFRLPKRNGGGGPSVIKVRFFKQLKRNQFMSAYLSYIEDKPLWATFIDINYPKSRIYINEFLSKQVRDIQIKAKSMKAAGVISKVLIRRGMVAIIVAANDSPKIVRSIEELDKFKS